MPRVNPLRPMGNELNLARRIALERQARDWSYEGLAKRLSDAGFPIQGSAIFKIEKGTPPRRITVDELVGFATVFGVKIEDLLLPADVVIDRATVEAFNRWASANATIAAAAEDRDQAMDSLRELLAKQDGEVRAALEQAMRGWIAATYPTSDMEEALEYFALTFANVPKSDRRWTAHYKKWR